MFIIIYFNEEENARTGDKFSGGRSGIFHFAHRSQSSVEKYLYHWHSFSRDTVVRNMHIIFTYFSGL